MLLLGALLLAVAALSALKHGAGSDDSGRERRACCPFLNVPDAMLVSSATNETPAATPTRQVIAYYFHATVRCETCLEIENFARTVIEQRFKAELDANRLMFLPVNYEQPQNAHFLLDYKLPCPSLVLVRQKDGKEETWKLLGETWQLVHDPEKLNRYVESEVRGFLNGQMADNSTNQFELPPAPDLR